ncbi:PLP-dependent aminotransferase family protein [Paraburkholderia bengalensis]|uniref:PLP-dependent aminotransferase family protein n=2 Tax=Paraburkholderia bengalensis TaxID=2747562 RepID=A0ABU8J6L6_9BURK
MSLDRDDSRPLNVQISEEIVERIRAGLLLPGTPLPGSREFAAILSVNRKTIVLVYDELAAQGWLSTEGRRGTFVSPNLPHVSGAHGADRSSIFNETLPHPAYQVYGSTEPLPEIASEGVIDFTDGAPDTRLVPFGALSGAFRLALLEFARGNQLGYSDPRGIFELRNTLASMLRIERGLKADPESLCVVRGSQMGIYVAARILVRSGDTVVLERLTYPPARDAFRACGASIVSIDQDEFGMSPESLRNVCKAQRVRAIYLTPHHQFPTTVTMPIERRMELLKLAEEFGFVIVEDDYDHEFHFNHNPMQPMAAIDRRGTVIYIGSLSKILAPGLRVGYIAAHPSIIHRIANEVVLIDRQGNSVTERAVADLMQSGELRRHIRHAAKVYHARCHTAAALVSEYLGPFASVDIPDGGLALWVRMAEIVDMDNLFGAAKKHKVKILPGSIFSAESRNVKAIRLGYASLNELEIKTGMSRIKSALSQQVNLYRPAA